MGPGAKIHAYIHTYTHTYIYTYIHVCMYACMYVCMYVCVYINTSILVVLLFDKQEGNSLSLRGELPRRKSVRWESVHCSQGFLPRILTDTVYSSLKTPLFSRARVGSASEYSNLEETLYKSP